MTQPHDPATVDTAAPDVYQAAAAAAIEAGARFAVGQTLDEQLPWLVSITTGDPRFRAAVDRAVELTEQRVRDELATADHALDIAMGSVEAGVAEIRQLRAQLARAEADRDHIEAQYLRDTDDLNQRLHRAIAALTTTQAERDKLAAAYRTLVGDLPELAARLRELVGALRGAEVDSEWTAAADRDTLRAVDGHSWAAGFEAGYATGRDDEAASLPVRALDEMAAGSGPGGPWSGPDAPGVPESTPEGQRGAEGADGPVRDA